MIDTHRQSRNPFEITAVIIGIYSGIAQLIVGAAPNNIERYASGAFQSSWTWLLLVSALICAVGIFMPDESWGLYLEVSGLLGMTFANISYGFTIIGYNGEDAFASFAAPYSIGFGIAFAIRAFFIIRKLYRVLRHPDDQLIEQVKGQLIDSVQAQAERMVKESRNGDKDCRKES
jgi:hypothetical protein